MNRRTFLATILGIGVASAMPKKTEGVTIRGPSLYPKHLKCKLVNVKPGTEIRPSKICEFLPPLQESRDLFYIVKKV